jgi:Meckelin (Transmembrane protein 67)
VRRDQLYFANISLCIFDEPAAGFLLDGKFLEPRSDDTLASLAGNLRKQREGSVTRTNAQSCMLFLGPDTYSEYTVRKAHARRNATRQKGVLQPPDGATPRSLLAPLKRHVEEAEHCEHTTVRTVRLLRRLFAMDRLPRVSCEHKAWIVLVDAARGQVATSFVCHNATVRVFCAQVHVCMQPVTPTFWQRWTRDVSVRHRAHGFEHRLVRASDSFKLWTSTVFYGQELRLVAFEVMLMGAIDLRLQSIAASACITWLMTFLVGHVRVLLGKRNTAKCTYVDECFLT